MKSRTTDAEIIEKLIQLLQEANASTSEPLGSCLFRAGKKTHFPQGLTKLQCDSLGGSWSQGR